MGTNKILVVFFLLICLTLTGCQSKALPEYSSELVVWVYGNDVIQESEILNLDSVTSEFSKCLFSVQGNGVDKDTLKAVAPNENPIEWDVIYHKNRTCSVLNAYQLLDVYVKSSKHVQCICVCEAVYSDWKTPEDIYLFIMQFEMVKNENWEVTSSELLSTAREADVVVARDDLTNAVKFISKKGGGEK